jgi:hypothetical protein
MLKLIVGLDALVATFNVAVYWITGNAWLLVGVSVLILVSRWRMELEREIRRWKGTNW